jgi:hypothetical protein
LSNTRAFCNKVDSSLSYARFKSGIGNAAQRHAGWGVEFLKYPKELTSVQDHLYLWMVAGAPHAGAVLLSVRG